MRIDVVTIFPTMFEAVLGESILKRARAKGLLCLKVRDLRGYTQDKRRTVDDRPYGGGPGMVMKPEPLVKAVEAIRRECGHATQGAESRVRPPAEAGGRVEGPCQVILMSPEGERLSQTLAQSLAVCEHLTILCGHYEGVDERVKPLVVDRTVSIGDYVLTGGELPAMVLIDCFARFIPGVIGHAQATTEESFADGLLEYPQYTRPPVFRNLAVPEILRLGDHRRVAQWRKLQSVARTLASRPDLAKPAVSNQQPAVSRQPTADSSRVDKQE